MGLIYIKGSPLKIPILTFSEKVAHFGQDFVFFTNRDISVEIKLSERQTTHIPSTNLPSQSISKSYKNAWFWGTLKVRTRSSLPPTSLYTSKCYPQETFLQKSNKKYQIKKHYRWKTSCDMPTELQALVKNVLHS